MKKILILGVGNYLMADEGVGVHMAKHLSKILLPDNVDILDGGTGGFHLLEYIESYPIVILIDATLDNDLPGTIKLIRPKFAKDFPTALSSHDVGLKDLIGTLQLLGKMPEIYLFAVSIRSIQEQGVALTPEIAALLPELEQRVLALVKALNLHIA